MFGMHPRPELGRGRPVAEPQGLYASVAFIRCDHPTGRKETLNGTGERFGQLSHFHGGRPDRVH